MVFTALGGVAWVVFRVTMDILSATPADVNLFYAAFMIFGVGGVMLISGFAFPFLLAAALIAIGQVLWEILKSVLRMLGAVAVLLVEETVREWCEEGN